MSNGSLYVYELMVPSSNISASDETGMVLINALEGYADAGNAVALTANYLNTTLSSQLIASFYIDELVDYRSRRPIMTFAEDKFTKIDSPKLNLYALKDTNDKAFLLLAGVEPDLHWQRFTDAVINLSKQFNVTKAISINAIPMTIPHTRPTILTAHASNIELIAGYRRWGEKFKIPGNATSLLELKFASQGVDTIGLSAHVPHYLSQMNYPPAAEVLVTAIAELSNLSLPVEQLLLDSESVIKQIQEQTEHNEEFQTVVAALEQQYDTLTALEQTENIPLLAKGETLPNGDEIGAELERFLAQNQKNNETPEEKS